MIETIIIILILSTPFLTSIRDKLQERLAHVQTETPSPAHSENRLLLIIFFPITLYLVIGTILLLSLTLLESVTKPLRHFCGKDLVEVIQWHQVSVVLTLLFPIAWLILAPMLAMVFVEALFFALLKVPKNIFNAFVRFLRKLWNSIVRAIKALFQWFIDHIRPMWKAIVNGMQTIWQLTVSTIELVVEYFNSLVREIWTQINGWIHG